MQILVLNKTEIGQIFTMREAIDAAAEAMRMYSSGQTDIPLRSNINIEKFQGQALFMPGYVAESDALGLKVVSVYPGNPGKGIPGVPSTMILLNSATGQVNALMDGTSLTQLRTAAMAGVATDLLARSDAKKFVLIGTGGQAQSQLEAVLSVRSIDEVQIYSRDPDHAKAFVERLPDYPGVRIQTVQSLDEAIAGADIVTTVTTALEPVFDGALIKPGTHINGMGSYTPQMSEIPELVLQRASKLYVDTMDAFTESGDFQKPLLNGTFDQTKLTGELGCLIAGEIHGRESDDEITFFESTGNASLDLVTAQKIYDKALLLGLGTWIEL